MRYFNGVKGRFEECGFPDSYDEDWWIFFKTCDPEKDLGSYSDPWFAYEHRDYIEFLARLAKANPEVFSWRFKNRDAIDVSPDEIRNSSLKDLFNYWADRDFESWLAIPFSSESIRKSQKEVGKSQALIGPDQWTELIHPDDAGIPHIE